jgi:hypothetical protein
MNCTHVEKLLPLYVEGDLEREQAEAVRSHLKSCQACSQLAAGYEESQSWLRSYAPPEFSDALFGDLRSAVRREIARAERRPTFFQLIVPRWGWQPVLAASLALLVVAGGLALYSRFGGAKQQSKPKEEIAGKPAPPHRTPPQQIATSSQDGGAAKGEAQPRPHPESPRPGFRKPPVAGLAKAEPAIEQPGVDPTTAAAGRGAGETASTRAAAAPGMLRIEIQTADPSIRIIWFVPQETGSPSAKPSTDSEEEAL